jgi:hypothetical protein
MIWLPLCIQLHSFHFISNSFVVQLHSLNAFCCAPLRQQSSGHVVSDEGFYDPELHSIDDDERVLHVPVCSVGAKKRVWNDLLALEDDDWSMNRAGCQCFNVTFCSGSASLAKHVVAIMEDSLGPDRAHRKSFDKQADLPAWYISLFSVLQPPSSSIFNLQVL